MRIDVVTPFPELVSPVLNESMLKQAQKKNVVDIHIWDLRDFSENKHRTVDDYPYGGGAGMVMTCPPFFRAVDQINDETSGLESKVVFLTPQGQKYNQDMADQLSNETHLIFLCGHYRGVDDRVIQHLVTDEISVGDYILTGGELPACIIIDSVVRLLPGVLNDFDSALSDSFVSGRLDYSHYTRPEVFRGLKVPSVLLSGNHAEIEKFRKEESLKRTRERRPDLLNKLDN